MIPTRYKALLAGLSALVVILAGALAWSLTRSSQPAAAPPPISSTPTEPTFNPSASDAGGERPHDDDAHDPEVDAEKAWRSVVDHFARNFTRTTGGDQQWRRRLAGDRTPPYVTDEVAKQLATVDVRNVPEGSYDGYTIVRSSAYDVSVKATYKQGWSLVMHLITDGTDWQVYAYDRWQQ